MTVDALAKHDAGSSDITDADAVMSDAGTAGQSFDAKTFNTWATNWTDCTNATFGRVHRYWTSNSAMHKEVINFSLILQVFNYKYHKCYRDNSNECTCMPIT